MCSLRESSAKTGAPKGSKDLARTLATIKPMATITFGLPKKGGGQPTRCRNLVQECNSVLTCVRGQDIPRWRMSCM